MDFEAMSEGAWVFDEAPGSAVAHSLKSSRRLLQEATAQVDRRERLRRLLAVTWRVMHEQLMDEEDREAVRLALVKHGSGDEVERLHSLTAEVLERESCGG